MAALGGPPKVIRPTVVGGPNAQLLADALGAVDVPANVVGDAELLQALVAKNLYIGVANIAGLVAGPEATVSSLWENHRQLAEDVAADVLDIQAHLTGASLDRAALIADMVAAFEADPAHRAMGRSAPQRLERALALRPIADRA